MLINIKKLLFNRQTLKKINDIYKIKHFYKNPKSRYKLISNF